MDMTFIYMALLAVLTVLSYMWTRHMKETKKTRAQQREMTYRARAGEKITNIVVTGIDHYEVNERVYGRRMPMMKCIVKFSYYDKEGTEYYGVYSSVDQYNISHITKVAYQSLNPKEYRVLGATDRTRPTYRVHHRNEGIVGILIDFILEDFFNKEPARQLQIILRLSILVLSFLVLRSFYIALFV